MEFLCRFLMQLYILKLFHPVKGYSGNEIFPKNIVLIHQLHPECSVAVHAVENTIKKLTHKNIFTSTDFFDLFPFISGH